MMGTAAVAIGTAAAVPGTLVNLAAGGGTRNTVWAGSLRVAPRWRGWTANGGGDEGQRAAARAF